MRDVREKICIENKILTDSRTEVETCGLPAPASLGYDWPPCHESPCCSGGIQTGNGLDFGAIQSNVTHVPAPPRVWLEWQ